MVSLKSRKSLNPILHAHLKPLNLNWFVYRQVVALFCNCKHQRVWNLKRVAGKFRFMCLEPLDILDPLAIAMSILTIIERSCRNTTWSADASGSILSWNVSKGIFNYQRMVLCWLYIDTVGRESTMSPISWSKSTRKKSWDFSVGYWKVKACQLQPFWLFFGELVTPPIEILMG